MSTTFSELGIKPELISALAKVEITEPTPIQCVAIPLLLQKNDLYVQAETGTGKTLAYLLPLFSRIDSKLASAQIVVIAPTHELAIQIQRQCTDLVQHSNLPIRVILLLGGTSLDRQLEKLKKKPQIVVGTLGRIRELIYARKLKMQDVFAVVVDEADRLLGTEADSDLQFIAKAAPKERSLIFVSATEHPEAARSMESISPQVQRVKTAENPVNQNIKHHYLVCEERERAEYVRRLIHACGAVRSIIFVHRNQDAEILAMKLEDRKMNVVDLHGELDKGDRKVAMDRVRSGDVDVLIASDVAARGLDIKGITHIFNYDVPTTSEAYLHRVGRTGRAGSQGIAFSLLTEQQGYLIQRFRKDLGIEITEVILRNGEVYAANPADSEAAPS